MKLKVSFGSMIPMYLIVFILCITATVFGSEAVTALTEQSQLTGRTCIIIDAGHGGVDGGATSCTGILESQINLDISIRLNDLLNLLGYPTKMIRTTDISVYTEGETIAAKKVSDLKNRVKTVNQLSYGLLISIHQNYFLQTKYHGAQVFFANDDESRALGNMLQNLLISSLNKESNRKAKIATGIYLMEHINNPGILVECGFISNSVEEAKLRDASYQKKLSCVISTVTANFLDRKHSA